MRYLVQTRSHYEESAGRLMTPWSSGWWGVVALQDIFVFRFACVKYKYECNVGVKCFTRKTCVFGIRFKTTQTHKKIRIEQSEQQTCVELVVLSPYGWNLNHVPNSLPSVAKQVAVLYLLRRTVVQSALNTGTNVTWQDGRPRYGITFVSRV